MDTQLPADPHSFYVPGQPKITHITWHIGKFDFRRKVMEANVVLTFDKPGKTNLDTRDLVIHEIQNRFVDSVPFTLGNRHDVLGSCLTFRVPKSCEVVIFYETSPKASGIQWMDAKLGGGKPFVYTQGEAINARSYIPCQDTPSIKFTLDAEVLTPKRLQLRALVAAAVHKSRSLSDNRYWDESWSMPFPIPSYLIAFAVGDLKSQDISERSRVWALPNVVDAAAEEFKDIEQLMQAGERLFGNYPFGRYDMLILPPAFPYGGMENPCLSFLTPALVAGDGSGIGTVAHELAHSWTGNLVTNANWDAFFLNEGPTVWAEQRILGEYWGRDAAQVHFKLLEREYLIDCKNFRKRGLWYLTKLAPGINDVDPDEIFSRNPYFKGAQLWFTIQAFVGQEKFDAGMRSYMDTFRFGSVTVEMVIDFLVDQFGSETINEDVRIQEWVYGEGLPSDAPIIASPLITVVERAAAQLRIPANDEDWSTEQRQLYLELLPRERVTQEFIAALDAALSLRRAQHVEVRWSFLVLALEVGYLDVLPQVEEFMHSQGRMKYLKPLYRALVGTQGGKANAKRIFSSAKSGYHPVAISAIKQELNAA